VGSIFRTAEALGVDKIFLTGYTGTPKNPRLAKTALGAEHIVAWEYQKQLGRVLDKLEREGFAIVALENNIPPLSPTSPNPSSGRRGMNGQGEKTTPLSKFKPKFPLALVLGEEVRGTPTRFLKMCDKIVEIPMLGEKESLNVSVAGGIAMYYVSTKR